MNTELPEAFDPTAQKGSEFSLIPPVSLHQALATATF